MSRIYRTLGTVAIEPKGEYDSTAYYEKLNVVTYQGSSYMAKQNVNNVLPTNEQYWLYLGGGVKKIDTIQVYDNVASMKADSALEDGMSVQTLGYYEANDGGGALYKIRNITNNDVDEMSIIALNDQNLIAEIIIDDTINVAQFGIMPSNDNTNDLINLSNVINKLDIKNVEFNNGTYNVTNYINFNINTESFKINFNDATIKLNANINYHNNGIFTINMNKNINSKCILINGNFDGSGTPADFSRTNIHPNGCRGMFFINGARYIKADNLYFNDWFYSACIWSHYCKNADITNITGDRIGGRSATNEEDARGDALYFGYIGVVEDENNTTDVINSYEVNINIENCKFSSWTAINNPYSDDNNIRNGCQSGRCGIVFGEYSNTNAQKNLNIINSYFYNYQRTIHLENIKNFNINVENTTFENYGEVILLSQGIIGNNISLNNCYFNKNVNVIPIYSQYNYLISGHTDNNMKNITINDSKIYDMYNGLILLGKDINFTINNSNIEIEKLKATNNSKVNINNSILKYNTTEMYNALININNCDIVGGYKNNESSTNFIYWTGTAYYTNENIKLINSRCKNVGILPCPNKAIITNNVFEYDTNFKNKDLIGTTRNYFFGFYANRLIEFSNNIINNSNDNTLTSLFDPANFSTGEANINDNIINNCKMNIYNASGYGLKVYNNTFKNENENITIAGDLYQSKLLLFNNQFIGYTGINNTSNATKWNNYLSTDGTSNTLIS